MAFEPERLTFTLSEEDAQLRVFWSVLDELQSWLNTHRLHEWGDRRTGYELMRITAIADRLLAALMAP